jgi:gluconate 2-dehydrogenase gamma chain
MQRREALRLLATGAVLQLTPGKLLFAMREARTVLATRESQRTLDAHQDATVKAMADLIIPRTDTPSASEVGVADFIDLIVTEWYNEVERKRFLDGLGAVDSRTTSLFGKNFIDCTASQQAEMLIELGAKMLEDAASGGMHWAFEGPAPPEWNFYADFRRLTLTGYYTSEVGAEKELKFEIIPDRYQGCDIAPATQEAAKQQ